MKSIKRRLSILLAALMVVTCINPYAVQVKAEETTSVEILSEEASEAKTPDKEESLAESSQEEKQEADEGALKEAEIKEENKEEIQEEVKEEAKEAELATRGGGAKEEAYTENDFEIIPGDTVTIKGLSASGKEKRKTNHNLVIPDMIDNKNVTVIGKDAFTGIGVAADLQFTSVTLPKYLKEIKSSAFAKNSITEINFPVSLERIDTNAFYQNKLEQVFIPEAVIEIGSSAFSKNKITKAEIDNCDDGIEVPVTVFTKNGADGKTDITPKYLKENPEWVTADFRYEDGINYSMRIVGLSNKGQEKRKTNHKLVIPKSIEGKYVVEIVDRAFFGKDVPEAEKFISVGLPERLVKIGEAAFSENKLSSVDFPKSLQTIGNAAFSQNEIKKVFIPESVTEIDIKAFAANNLTQGEVKIDNTKANVTIGESAFGLQGTEQNVTVEPIFLKDVQPSAWETSDFKYGKVKIQGMELEAVTGFSEAGLEKLKTVKDLVLPTKNDKEKPIEAVGNMAFKGTLGEKRLNTLTIPEGYKAIGISAFMLNRCGGALKLPSTMEYVGASAFFRNEFTSLVIPEKMTVVPVAMMRGNNLKEITFKGQVKIIDKLAFAENYLEEVNIPDSLKTIGDQAFRLNTGNPYYDDKVVLKTKNNNNPNKLDDTQDYVVDPKETTSKPLDYTKWEVADFTYQGQTVTGFSKSGSRKIKRNKNLVIPDKTADNKNLLVIGLDAFRGIDMATKPKPSPRDYNIEKLTIPDTVVRIKNYAFQFNKLEEVTLPKSLKKLGYGVFMSNNLTKINFNNDLEEIDQICFYGNDLRQIVLPASVKKIMRSAFRKTNLTDITFAKGSNLELIDTLALADNPLKTITLPEGLKEIGHQAFGNCQFTEITVPDSLKDLGFQTFINNPGKDGYNKAVLVNTKDKKNPNELLDDAGKTYVVDPSTGFEPTDKEKLQEAIAKAETVDVNKLTAQESHNHKELFEQTLKEAKEAVNKDNVSKWYIKALTRDVLWATRRSTLSMLILEKENLDKDKAKFDQVKWADLETAYKLVAKKLLVIDLEEEYLQKLEYELELTLKNLYNQGPLHGAEFFTGEAETPTPYSNVAPYTIKMKVWVKDGKIVMVHDNETECDEPGEDHNIGYFNKSLLILNRFKNKDVKAAKESKSLKALGIDTISGATISSHTIYKAIKNALEKAPVNPNPQVPNPPVNPDPPTVDPIPDNGGFIPPLDSGSSSGSSSSGSSIDSTARTENTIKDDETPLANVPNEAQALILKSKKNTVKLTDKQLFDLITGKYTHIEITVGAVTVKLMPQDVKPFFKKGNGKNYLKISKLSKAEIKKLKLDKKLSKEDAYKVELMISGQKVMNLKKKATVQMLYTGEIKKDIVTVLLAESKKTIKAKYNKKTKMIEFKTNKIGTFLVLK